VLAPGEVNYIRGRDPRRLADPVVAVRRLALSRSVARHRHERSRGEREPLKYEFRVRPEHGPSDIKLAYRGRPRDARRWGGLLLDTPMASYGTRLPSRFQDVGAREKKVLGGKKKKRGFPVEARYAPRAGAAEGKRGPVSPSRRIPRGSRSRHRPRPQLPTLSAERLTSATVSPSIPLETRTLSARWQSTDLRPPPERSIGPSTRHHRRLRRQAEPTGTALIYSTYSAAPPVVGRGVLDRSVRGYGRGIAVDAAGTPSSRRRPPRTSGH